MKNLFEKKARPIFVGLVFFALSPILFLAFKSNKIENKLKSNSDINTPVNYRTITNNAFNVGEKLNYRVHYGLVNAANITMEVMASNQTFDRPNELVGRSAYHIVTEGKTIKAFDWAYKVRDKFESWVDQESLAPLKYAKQVQENKYIDQDLVFFRHPSSKLNGKKGALDMSPYTQDIVSVLYYARNIDYAKAKKGDLFPIHVYLDNKIYDLNFKFDGIETIKSDIGKVKCYKLIPKLVVDRVFKSEEDMTIWISADDNKIPIRVQSDIQVGSLKVDLTSYQGLRNTFSAKLKK